MVLNPRQNLQTRLGISTAATAIALSAFLSVLVGQISRSQLENQIQRSLEQLAHQAADRLDQGMFERYRDIGNLAVLDRIRQVGFPNEQKRIYLNNEQQTYPDYAWIGLTDSQGKVIASTQGILEGKDVSARSWYQKAQASRFVGDVHEAKLLAKLLPNSTGEPLRFVDIAAPVKDAEGHFLGVMGAHLSWEWAKEVQHSIETSLGNHPVEVLILDREGTVILGAKSVQGQEIKLSSLKSNQASGFSIDVWSDRTSYATSFARTQGYRDYPGLGWTVLVRQQEAIALAPARSLQLYVFLSGVVMGGLFAFWNWFRSRQIVQPLLLLTKAAEQITQGKPAEIPTFFDRQDELALLSKAFETMVETLQEQTEQLQQDIKRREAAELKIREQAELLDVATDAIFVRSLDGVILFWNRGAERIYGWSAEEALGQCAKTLLNRESSPALEDALSTTLAAGEWHGELQKVTKSDQLLTVDSHWWLAYDPIGNPKFILTVDTDISEKKQLEAQFLRTQRLESLGTLAGGIAHDMNNILTPIRASAQLLQLKLSDLDTKAQRLLQILVESTQRGSDLVKQILSFARGFEGERSLIQSRHILKEVVQIAQSTFPKSIEIQYNAPSQDLWTLCADATQLHQVLMNLCVNARDAMPEGGTLRLSAENFSIDPHYVKLHPDAEVGEYVLLTVADTGEGMSAEVVDRIFEPFYTTKEIGKGTGLGLSTVLGIIKSHKGFIQVYSEVGQGTHFSIYLPATFEAVSPVIEEAAIPDGKGELILVIDDEPLILEVAKSSLEAHQYQVITANHGVEALECYQKLCDRIDLVLIDLMMPELDGTATIQALRELNPHLKIVASSGLMRSELVSDHVDAFLSKPYTLRKLLTTIQAVLD